MQKSAYIVDITKDNMENESNSDQDTKASSTSQEENWGTYKIKRSALYKIFGVVVLIVIVLMLFNIFSNGGAQTNVDSKNYLAGNVVAASGDVQVAKIRVDGGQYIIEPSSFKKGITVRLEGDLSNMPGCSKSIVISAFNVKKSLSNGDNIIEFTPDKAGTFNIACSMNMYKGTFTVLEADGTKSSYTETAPSGGHTCGGSGGGCGGCGG